MNFSITRDLPINCFNREKLLVSPEPAPVLLKAEKKMLKGRLLHLVG